MNNRQIALDTETTGLEVTKNHRIIEIGCVEITNRRTTNSHFHYYLQPDRPVEQGALDVHGITDEFLHGKPRFSDIVDEFIAFIQDAELIIHNANFDVGFLNYELQLLKRQPITHYCQITDNLALARERHPGQKNNLDALCKRYGIDNTKRELHGALLDAELLAAVYLAMTGGQNGLLNVEEHIETNNTTEIQRITTDRARLSVILPTEEELTHHHQRLTALDKASGGQCLWLQLIQ